MTTTVAADRNPSNTCISDGFTTRRIVTRQTHVFLMVLLLDGSVVRRWLP